MTMISQNLKDLQWKKRAVVIYSSTFQDPQAQEQVKLLKENKEKFSELKLVVIEHSNDGERMNFENIDAQTDHEELKGFKVFLVGLDGGVKFESSTVQPAQKFFDLINSMPMRQSEIRNKG